MQLVAEVTFPDWQRDPFVRWWLRRALRLSYRRTAEGFVVVHRPRWWAMPLLKAWAWLQVLRALRLEA